MNEWDTITSLTTSSSFAGPTASHRCSIGNDTEHPMHDLKYDTPPVRIYLIGGVAIYSIISAELTALHVIPAGSCSEIINTLVEVLSMRI